MLSTSSKELGTRHQTPTLIGCIFLKTPQNKPDQNLLYFANLAAINEALNSSTVFEELSKLFVFSSPRLGNPCNLQQPPPPSEALYSIPVFNPPRTQNQTFFANLPSHLQQHLSTATNHPENLTLLQSGLSSEAFDYSTLHTTQQGKPAVWAKNQHSLQTHQQTTGSTASV